MSSRQGSRTTTEEYQVPSGGQAPRGRPALLCSFPRDVAVSLPDPGEIVGRAWLDRMGVRDTKSSGEHLRFSRGEGRFFVEDVGSRNGTWVDGQRIPARQRAAIDDGAIVRLGCTALVFRASFAFALSPAPRIGKLVGPWGLGDVRAQLEALPKKRERNVLVEGATGTGKELIAAAVILALGRAKKRWATINVAAVPAGVFEAQLFGWQKGAHSGAAQAGRGVVRENDGGCVVLDEIGELPMDLQPKLLRLLENGEIQPVGGGPVSVDVAILASTNRPLAEAVLKGSFRRDLYARFTERIVLPALADRPEDVMAILRALVERRGATLEEGCVEVDAIERLLQDDWPANVRDLDRVAAAFAAEGRLTRALVDSVLGAWSARAELTREEAERMVGECDGNEREAERRFHVSRGKLRRALGKVGRGGQVS